MEHLPFEDDGQTLADADAQGGQAGAGSGGGQPVGDRTGDPGSGGAQRAAGTAGRTPASAPPYRPKGVRTASRT
jgi:hypothetical protein